MIKKDLNELKIVALLNGVTALMKAEDKMHSLTRPYKNYGTVKDDWGFYDYHNILDIVYLELTGFTEPQIYSRYKTTDWSTEDKPIAWYGFGKYQIKPYLVVGNKLQSVFIPDCINDTILNSKANGQKKYEILTQMFKDLARCEASYKRRKTLAAKKTTKEGVQ